MNAPLPAVLAAASMPRRSAGGWITSLRGTGG
jgi:hypothetical protein